jgi:biotin carboxyl carrier protein
MEKKDLGILNIDTTLYHTRVSNKYEKRKPYKPADPGLIFSFIPGTVLEILVSEGDVVSAGSDLLVLDAMKMQNRIKSPVTGKVIKINVRSGDRVPKGVLLLELEPVQSFPE